MSFLDLLRDTLATLWAHKLRTGLTMFGIAWGIVSITLMVASGEGLRVGQAKQAETMGKDMMIVWAGRTSLQAGGLRAGRKLFFRSTDIPVLEAEAFDCQSIIPDFTRTLKVCSPFNSGSLTINGATPPFQHTRSIGVATGHFHNWEDEAKAHRVAFLGTDAKKQLYGERDPIGSTIMLQGLPFQVIGVMAFKEQDSSYNGPDVKKIFVPASTILRDFPEPEPAPPHTIDNLLVVPKAVEQHLSCKAQFLRTLGRLHGFNPADKEAAPMDDTIENAAAFKQMTDGMKYFLGAVGVTTLFLGGLSVMNVMLIAVRERTREIGIRKAVGATRRAIVAQFFVETSIIVFLSGGVGMATAHGICGLVNLAPMPPFFAGLLATWETSALAFGLLALVAILAALYPAFKAASIDPIEALRFEPGS